MAKSNYIILLWVYRRHEMEVVIVLSHYDVYMSEKEKNVGWD